MNTDLKNALASLGWAEVYGRYVHLTGRVNASGEMRGVTPWPDYPHDQDSFCLNVHKGVFDCKRSGRAGTFIQFLAWMEGEEDEETGEFLPADMARIERRLAIEQGVLHPVEPGWLAHCQQSLTRLRWQTAFEGNLQRLGKWWEYQTLVDLGVGWDEEEQRFVLPCHDQLGALVNARLYLPGGKPKTKWKHSSGGTPSNFLFPHQAWEDPILILCEGEADALTLRSLGFPGASGTLGSAQPVPEGWWFRGKSIYLCFDVDEQGRKATADAVQRLARDAEHLWVVDLPEWEGRPDNADISDYVAYLRANGTDADGIRAALLLLLQSAREVTRRSGPADMEEAVAASFVESRAPSFVGKRVRFRAQILGLSNNIYRMPVTTQARCPARGHKFCSICPMKKAGGEMTVTHNPSDQSSLRLIGVDTDRQTLVLKDLVGVTRNCPDFRAEGTAYVNVHLVVIGPPLDDDDAALTDRCAAYVVLKEDARTLEATFEYSMTGFCYSHPRDQTAVYMIDDYEAAATSVSSFQMTDEIREELRVFQPRTGQSVYDKLADVAQDLSDSVTGIRGRPDLHMAYRSVWHSSISFRCGKEQIERGWLECLVVGDTRCGKSQTYRRMANFLDMGTWVDCKNQSVAGILGSADKLPSGEWYVMPGLMPQNDQKIIGFDEFNTKLDQGCVIQFLASARSEGLVVISKAGRARFRARVRSIWLANPGQGRLLSEIGRLGVEVIPRLIQQPEDITRFDFALIVAQEDIPAELLQETEGLATSRYGEQASRNLLLWAWSRQEAQKQFTDAAVRTVAEVANRMVAQYSDQVPIVERNEQRKRVAKLAISIAAQCFSTDESGEMLLVTEEHVAAAEELFHLWYDKPAMGYDVYSKKSAVTYSIVDTEVVRRVMSEHIGSAQRVAVEQMLSIREFTEKTFSSAIGCSEMIGRGILQVFHHHRVLQVVQGGSTGRYELSPAGTRFLKAMLSEIEAQEEHGS